MIPTSDFAAPDLRVRAFAAPLQYQAPTACWTGAPPFVTESGSTLVQPDLQALRSWPANFSLVVSNGYQAWAASDRFNTHRLYYSTQGERLTVASSLLGLKKL